ncbi:MAG: hypothetical protein KF825_10640 [Ferruginibacter sp.]|nr:hypothetical protein [Ferruginibacter sp.]
MQETLHYYLDHSSATVNLTLTDRQFIAETQGKGVLDKPQHINILISSIKKYCLVATNKVQNLNNARSAGDYTYDSEFIFLYPDGQKMKTKRIFVDSLDANFVTLLNELKHKQPNASLLHLPQEEALKQIGVTPAAKTIRTFLWLLVGIPAIVLLIFILTKILKH